MRMHSARSNRLPSVRSRRVADAWWDRTAAVGLAIIASMMPAARAADHPGLAVYREHCVRCHGPDGSGTKNVPEPLAGDRSVNQLAAVIDETMPEDDPALVTGDAARQVAEYIHAAFYSRVARERNRPPRVEPSRLTARQYRNAIVDIFSAGEAPPADDGRRGLEAKYFSFRRKGGNELVIDRIDPRVDFQFGVESADPERIRPGRFVIQWTGAIVPPDTGTYEFVVRTDHAATLAVNHAWHQPPLIDASVKSGEPNEVVEYRAKTFLLGGRAYPLRLEFKKTAPGVSASDEAPSANASITLLWKPPHGPLEPVPEWALRPHAARWTIFPTTPFPPDDRLTGFERGSSVSQEWYSATTAAGGEIADFCLRNVHVLVAPHDAPDRAAKLRAFAARVATAALRRQLTPELEAAFIDRPFADAATPDTGLERSLLLVLGSPRFLFREVGGGVDDPFATASRMSFGMWDSVPDQQLLGAAQYKRLATPEQVRQQAERMVKDRRTRLKLRDFLASWLRIDISPEITKDPRAFPGFSAEVAADLRTSLWLTIDDVIDRGGDFRRLVMDDEVYLNGRLAPLYGVSLPPDAGFRRVRLDDGRRAGVLSHPYLMSVLAHADTTSPILRGVFLARTVLGNSRPIFMPASPPARGWPCRRVPSPARAATP
jgi:mono/diheme cytochrome c family protein